MSYRAFFTAQHGREARPPALPPDDAPWGTTSSSVMRAYEPAEMRNSRSTPALARTASGLQSSSLAKSGQVSGAQTRAASMTASAVTADRSAASRGSAPAGPQAKQELPAHALVSRRPPPVRPYLGLVTKMQEHEAQAAKARQRHFPYRDEFHPRSKRLLYEMALQQCVNEDAQSASTDADTMSCFTLASSKASRSTATQSQAKSEMSRVPTADSKRVPGGIAKRRYEAQTRSPMLWAADEEWYREKYSQDGPAGLQPANFSVSMLGGSCMSHGERIAKSCDMIGGTQDNFSRKQE